MLNMFSPFVQVQTEGNRGGKVSLAGVAHVGDAYIGRKAYLNF